MKLRSGTVLDYNSLPEALDNELNADLIEFKELFAGNITHAIELIEIISSACSINERGIIRAKIDEVYNDKELEKGISPFLAITGALLLLITGDSSFYKENHIKPKYQDLIQDKMLKFFETDISLNGAIDQNNTMELQ